MQRRTNGPFSFWYVAVCHAVDRLVDIFVSECWNMICAGVVLHREGERERERENNGRQKGVMEGEERKEGRSE